MGNARKKEAGEIELSKEESLRYSRQLLLPEIGVEGQRALKSSSVLVIGAGGLGSPAAIYLAAAGIGRLGIVDADAVDLSNLHRQILHASADVGKAKVESAAETLTAINPHVVVDARRTQLNSGNAMEILAGYDLILDGTDNFPTRYLVNDACVLLGKPNIYGSVFRFEGQTSVFAPKLGGPCYRCLYPAPPPPGVVPSCAEGGVMGVLPGIIGSLQALSAIMVLTGQKETLVGRMLTVDGLTMKFRELKVRRDPTCPACGESPTIRALIDYEDFCGLKPISAATRGEPDEISVEELKSRLDSGEELFLLDVREPEEYDICNLDGHLIPMGELMSRMNEITSSGDIVVYCRTGNRSTRAVYMLRQAGFKRVYNLEGGIDAWARRIDPSMPRY